MVNQPLVSVVVSTYNRSNVLGYTIRTILAQTAQNFEVEVIGDCCTDDTEAVVASFNDPRLRFVNLQTNSGEQAIPNTIGMERARGRYIAMINHDNLWYPDHLERALFVLERGEAEFTYSIGAFVVPNNVAWAVGVPGTPPFVPGHGIGCSTWVFRREVFDRVGPWRPARELFTIPSQDWLYRVGRSRTKIQGIPYLTMVEVSSQGEANTYSDRKCAENEKYYRMVSEDPCGREELLRRVLLYNDSRPIVLWRTPRRTLRRMYFHMLVRDTVAKLGYNPRQFFDLWRTRGRKGWILDMLRDLRGLSPLPRPRDDNQQGDRS